MTNEAAQNKKTLTIVYVLAFSNLFFLTFMEYQHAQTMARVQREIFELQDDVVSLHERVVKLQKATFGVVEPASIDKKRFGLDAPQKAR